MILSVPDFFMISTKNPPLIRFFFLLFLSISLISCDNEEDYHAPKPKGYMRIELPTKEYKTYSEKCPFSFSFPAYSKIVIDKNQGAMPCWLDIVFPTLNATIHLSYKPVENNLGQILEDSRLLAIKHQVKASGIMELPIQRDSSHVYGLIYKIEGNAASSIQFYLTDSTKNFLRGSLYFNSPPNKDSVAPVLAFIQQDIQKMIQTFSWK